MDKQNNTGPIEVFMKNPGKKRESDEDVIISHEKCPLVLQWEPSTVTQEIRKSLDLPPDRKEEKRAERNFVAAAAHLEMMSSGEKNNVCFLFRSHVNKVQGPVAGAWAPKLLAKCQGGLHDQTETSQRSMS